MENNKAEYVNLFDPNSNISIREQLEASFKYSSLNVYDNFAQFLDYLSIKHYAFSFKRINILSYRYLFITDDLSEVNEMLKLAVNSDKQIVFTLSIEKNKASIETTDPELLFMFIDKHAGFVR